MLEGTIGEAATVELVAFPRLFRQLPSIDEILLNPDAAPLPDEPSARIAIATALGRALADDSIAKGVRYSIATMATNGVSLFYNPQFVDTLNAAELASVLAHEVMHPALQHHTRRCDRDRARWNIACDYAINPILLDAGLTLPKDVLIDNRFRGMSAERIYNLIEQEEDPGGTSEQPKSQPGTGGDMSSTRTHLGLLLRTARN